MSGNDPQRWYRIHIAALLLAFALSTGMYLDPVRAVLVTEPMTVTEIRTMFLKSPVATLTGPLIRWMILHVGLGAVALYAFVKSELALREVQG